jgi:hypothetical protein
LKRLCLAAVFSLSVGAAQAEFPEAGVAGRYQLVVRRAESGKLCLFRVDTQTGKVWIYDETQRGQPTPEYVSAHPELAEWIKQQEADGRSKVYITSGWTEIPERNEESFSVVTPPLAPPTAPGGAVPKPPEKRDGSSRKGN